MSTTTNHKRTRLIALVTALLVVAGILGLAPRVGNAANEKGTLTVSKTLAGAEEGDATEFEFTLELTVPAGTTLPEPLTYTTTDDKEATATLKTKADNVGTYTFKLKGDESANFELDVQSQVKVTEAEVEGWTSAAKVQIGKEAARDMKAGESLPIATNAPVTVDVTNTKDKEEETTETGKLTVSKEVKGTEDETLLATEFDFKVVLKQDGKDLNGTYKYTGSKTGTLNNGESISLKGGQSIDIEGIPAGVNYTVTEAKKTDWTPEKEELTGTIEKDKAVPAAFTNTYVEPTSTDTGSLKIAKNVVTETVDKSIAYAEQEGQTTRAESLKSTKDLIETLHFSFTVELKDKDGNVLEDRYNYSGTKDGKETSGTIKSGESVILRHEDAITISDLPTGTTYTVSEKGLLDSDETKYSNYWKLQDPVSGTIAKDKTADATFTNTGKGDLKISKTIRSRSGNTLSDDLKNTEFTFTVNFTVEGKDVEGEYEYTGSRSGKIKSGDTITLMGGESVTFQDLDVGMIARVEETAVDNWQPNTTKPLSGDIKLGIARTASFTNTYQDYTSGSSVASGTTYPRSTGTTTAARTTTPATADDTNVVVPVVLGALAVGLVAAGRVVRSKE